MTNGERIIQILKLVGEIRATFDISHESCASCETTRYNCYSDRLLDERFSGPAHKWAKLLADPGGPKGCTPEWIYRTDPR